MRISGELSRHGSERMMVGCFVHSEGALRHGFYGDMVLIKLLHEARSMKRRNDESFGT